MLAQRRNELSQDDISDGESVLLRDVEQELGGGGRGRPELELASSPPRPASVRERTKSKRASTPGTEDGQAPPRKREKKNSERYPKVERPRLFQDDEKFDSLGPNEAGNVCYQHSLEEEKRKSERKKEMKGGLEKCDDVIQVVMIPAGEDDAKNKLNIEARMLLRPVVKEIGKCMEWFPIDRADIIRSLPLMLYGLQDGVSSKAIELAHNLAFPLELKMFSPANLRSSASSLKKKAFADEEGKLVVEQADNYEEMQSTNEVLMAWNTLDCIWQKVGAC